MHNYRQLSALASIYHWPHTFHEQQWLYSQFFSGQHSSGQWYLPMLWDWNTDPQHSTAPLGIESPSEPDHTVHIMEIAVSKARQIKCLHLYLWISDGYDSLSECIIFIYAHSGDQELSILYHGPSRAWPVLGTHLHPSLLTPTQHHHHTTLPLIQHLHKVPCSDHHWTLSNDETFSLLVALHYMQAHNYTHTYLQHTHVCTYNSCWPLPSNKRFYKQIAGYWMGVGDYRVG